MWWDMLIALGAGILAGWLALLVALVLMRPKGALLAEAVRLLPDLLADKFDIAMSGMSGPELQHELTARGHAIKIIFITARGDGILRGQLIARGAVDCLFKPFSSQELKAALDSALPGS